MKVGGTYMNPAEEKPKVVNRIKRMKMVYRANEPTVTGIIYKEDDLKRIFDEVLNRDIPIVRNDYDLCRRREDNSLDVSVRVSNIIGFFRSYDIIDNDIFIHVYKLLGESDLFDLFKINTLFFGNVREDKSVNISGLIGFFLCHNRDIVIDNEK
jgi:hypothetical protein